MQKNIAIYHIYRIIENESDAEHKLTQKYIADKLKAEYGIVLERKAIGRAIDELAEVDKGIVKIPHGGVYMDDRKFDSCELFFLLDSVYYNKELPQNHARTMINKLISLGSVSFREQCNEQYKEDVVSRPEKSNLLLYLEVVNEAIRNQVKIQVTFGEESIKLCPLAMALNHGQYWLVTAARPQSSRPAEHFPIALIDNITVTKEKMRLTPEQRLGNLRLYLTKGNPNHFAYTDMIRADIKVNNIFLEKFEETFGKEYFITSKNEREFIAQVYSETKKIELWCLDNYMCAELISPDNLRKRIIEKLQKCLKKYTDNK